MRLPLSRLIILLLGLTLSACNLMLGQPIAQSPLLQSTYGAVVGNPGSTQAATTAPTVQAITATLTATLIPTVAPPTQPQITLTSNLMGIQAYGYIGPEGWGQMLERAYNMGF